MPYKRTQSWEEWLIQQSCAALQEDFAGVETWAENCLKLIKGKCCGSAAGEEQTHAPEQAVGGCCGEKDLMVWGVPRHL